MDLDKAEIKQLKCSYTKQYYNDNKQDIIKYGITYYRNNTINKRNSYSYNKKITAKRFDNQAIKIEKQKQRYFKDIEII